MATTKLTSNLFMENPDHLALVRIIASREDLTNDYVYPTIKQGQIRKARYHRSLIYVKIGLTQKELAFSATTNEYTDLVFFSDVEFISWL